MSDRFPGSAARPLPAAPAGTARRRRSAFASGTVAPWALAVLVALALGAVAAPGTASEVSSTQLSDGHAFSEIWFASTPPQVSPDGQYAVYVQDAVTNGAHELWSVPLAGGNPVRLSDVLLAGQSVKFAISPDSNYVVYVTDQDVVGVPELYSVPITGGSRTKLNMNFYALPGQVARLSHLADERTRLLHCGWRGQQRHRALAGRHRRRDLDAPERRDHLLLRHLEYAVGLTTGGSERVVYRVGRVDDERGTSCGACPGPVRRRRRAGSAARCTDGAVEPYFQISPNGTRVLYSGRLTANASFNLYSVAITGGTSIQLNGALGGANGVEAGLPDQPGQQHGGLSSPTKGPIASSSSTACR